MQRFEIGSPRLCHLATECKMVRQFSLLRWFHNASSMFPPKWILLKSKSEETGAKNLSLVGPVLWTTLYKKNCILLDLILEPLFRVLRPCTPPGRCLWTPSSPLPRIAALALTPESEIMAPRLCTVYCRAVSNISFVRVTRKYILTMKYHRFCAEFFVNSGAAAVRACM